MSRSPAVDSYIANSAEFARPILTRVRAAMHKACPQIEETMKWSAPFFEYKGVVAYMAGFNMHARFGFWKQRLMNDPAGLFKAPGSSGMGGSKIRSAADLPSDAVLIRYIKAAVALNELGAQVPRPARKKRPPPKPPADLVAAFKMNPKAIQWMAEGKTRHWKYQNC